MPVPPPYPQKPPWVNVGVIGTMDGMSASCRSFEKKYLTLAEDGWSMARCPTLSTIDYRHVATSYKCAFTWHPLHSICGDRFAPPPPPTRMKCSLGQRKPGIPLRLSIAGMLRSMVNSYSMKCVIVSTAPAPSPRMPLYSSGRSMISNAFMASALSLTQTTLSVAPTRRPTSRTWPR